MRNVVVRTHKRKKRYGHAIVKSHLRHIRVRFSDGKIRNVPFIEPMRPMNTEKPMTGKNWLGEEKKDGSLTMQYSVPGAVAYVNRRGVDKTQIYPELSDRERVHAKGLTIIQGEAYALKGRKDNFDAFLRRDLLQDPVEAKKRMKKYPLKFEAFDILVKDGKDVRTKPLSDRKQLLKEAIPRKMKDVKVSKYMEDTLAYRNKLKKDKTVEGIIYKDKNSLYKSGKQPDWRKEKFTKEADLIMTGYNKGEGKRKQIGAINMGVYDKGKVKEVATVGSGFTDQQLKEFKNRIDAGEKITAKVEYLNLGSQGRLRAPVFIGERRDIKLKETHV